MVPRVSISGSPNVMVLRPNENIIVNGYDYGIQTNR